MITSGNVGTDISLTDDLKSEVTGFWRVRLDYNINLTYGYVYVAKVAVGADPNQLVRAFVEAEAYNGPSIIIAYAHCIAHGIDMGCALLNDQKKAVTSGHWPLIRYNPNLNLEGKNPFSLDSKDPTISFEDYAYGAKGKTFELAEIQAIM